MSLKTRLDARSENNNLFNVIDKSGNQVAVVKLSNATNKSATLEIETAEDLYITKPSGWSSKKE
jgi:hypothetical protein